MPDPSQTEGVVSQATPIPLAQLAETPGTRMHLYYVLGGFRPDLPPHCNFSLPLTEEARFGVHLQIARSASGLDVQRTYYMRGREVDEAFFLAELDAAREAHAAKASAALASGATETEPFPGVAFGYTLTTP